MESAASWREVTDAQKRSLESAAAAYVPPSEPLKARAKAAGITWNDCTGYFELNGLTDLTADDVESILTSGRFSLCLPYAGAQWQTLSSSSLFRTNICTDSSDALRHKADGEGLCYNQSNLEVFRVGSTTMGEGYSWVFSPVSLSTAFTRCRKLRSIIGEIRLDKCTDLTAAFTQCPALADVKLRVLGKPINLKDCAALSYDSIAFMVQYAKNTTAITITLHADAFARLTDELIAEASAKNISFATP